MKRPHDTPQIHRESVADPDQRALVDRLRALILAAAPDVQEGVRYGMLDYPGIANLAARR